VLIGATPGPNLATQIANADRHATVPPLVMADEEGGGVQRLAALVGSLPWPRQMAASMTTSQVVAAVSTVARRMRALGVTVDLAPVLDVDGGDGPSSTNPDGQRSFSADPSTVSRYGMAFVEGLRQGGVLAVVKHFPGLGGASANTDYGPATALPFSTLRGTALPPFKAAVAAGAAGVMMANASVPGLSSGPVSLSTAAIQQVLRGDLGFSGLVITDSLSAGAITSAHNSVPQASAAAIEAGADMVMFGSTLTAADVALLSPANVAATTDAIISSLAAAVRVGQLPQGQLNEAVLKVLTAKGIHLCPGS
jgi:beta-N-acetylhexosaminidase